MSEFIDPPATYATQLRNDPEYVAYLEQRIAVLEGRLPKSDIISPKFVRRAFAVLGHYMAAGAIVYAVVLAIVLVFGLIGGGIEAVTSAIGG